MHSVLDSGNILKIFKGDFASFLLTLLAITVGVFIMLIVIFAVDYNEYKRSVEVVKHSDKQEVIIEILPDLEKANSVVDAVTTMRALDHAHLHFKNGIEWAIGFGDFLTTAIFKSKVYERSDNYKDMGSLTKYVLYCYLAVISMYILVYISFVGRYKISKEQALRESRTMIENKTHMNLTESLHHELNMPMAIIGDGLRDIKELAGDKIKDLGYGNITCDKIISNMEKAIEQINGTLAYLSRTKQIRYSNGNISVLDILENIEANANRFSRTKINMRLESPDGEDSVLADVSASVPDFGNSSMLNIMNVIVNNAIEARATEIVFSVVEKSKLHIIMHIKDNGTGIMDEFGNVSYNKNIFKYGYSTKDLDGESVSRQRTFYSVLMKFLGLDISTGDKSRGSGLYISNQILYKTGGSIWIHETSPEGTTMAIKFPYKPLHKD